MAKKYYAVRQGRVPGVYATWADCEKQVKGFGGAIYKSFPTEAEARAFVEDSGLSLSDFMSAHKGELNCKGKKITTKVSSGIQNKVSAGEETRFYSPKSCSCLY
ncbi:MAG: viroplasmin family protein [Veillonella sp.]